MRRTTSATRRRLATVFFTDVVGSTETAARLGDRRWSDLLAVYRRTVRRSLRHAGGREIDNAGDGFFAVFDQPASAIACACTVTDELHSIGIESRTGVHMGEVETVGGKLGGIAVHIGARLSAQARPGQVLISSTIRDVVSGSDYGFDDVGTHSLKGVPGEWRLFTVSWPGARRVDEDAMKAWLEGARPGRRSVLLRRLPIAGAIAVIGIAGGVTALVLHARTPPAIVPGADTVAQIDPSTNAFVAATQAGTDPTGVAIGGGYVWVVNFANQTVSRVDPTTGAVASKSALGSPTGIAYGGGFVWVSDGFGTTAGAGSAVIRFDAAAFASGGAPTPKVIDLSGSGSIAFGFGSLWVADPLDGTVLRIDPTLASVVGSPIPVGRDPESVAVGPSAVWVVNKLDATLTRIDPQNNAPTPPTGLGVAPDSVAADASGVWVASTSGNTLVHIDAASQQIVSTYKTAAGPVAVALDGGNVWLADGAAHEVERFNASTGRSVATLSVRGRPAAIAAQGGSIWTTISS